MGPVLDKLYKNAFQAIKIQLIPATGPIDRIVVVHADAKMMHAPRIPQLIKDEKTLRLQPHIQAPVGCTAADFLPQNPAVKITKALHITNR